MQDLNDKVTGNTLTAVEWNEVPSEIQNVIEALGISLSSGDLNQLGKGIAGYVANSTFYTDGGVADAYVLSVIGNKQTATAYTDGFQIGFLADNTNTGASTVNAAGLGVKNLKDSTGADLIADAVTSGEFIVAVYNDGAGEFRLVPQLTRTKEIELKSGRKNLVFNGVPLILQLGPTFSKASDVGPYYLYDGWFGSQTGGGVGSEDWSLVVDTLISGQEVPFVRVVQSGTAGTTRYCHIIDKESAEGLSGNDVTFSLDILAEQATGSTFDLFVTFDTDGSTLNSPAATATDFEDVGTQAASSLANSFNTTITKASITATIPVNAQRIAVILKINGATAGHSYRFSALQLELGTFGTDYEFLSEIFQKALAFTRFWDSGTIGRFGFQSNAASTFRNVDLDFPFPMISAPALTLSGTVTWVTGTITQESFNANNNIGDTTSDATLTKVVADSNL